MDQRNPPRQLAPPPLGWLPSDSFAAGRRSRQRRADVQSRRFLQPEASEYGSTPCERWRLIVEGRVQGVGYRAACCRHAKTLGLGGWVRNLPDGRVEVQAEGEPQALQSLRSWCENGPPAAGVNHVASLPIGPTGEDWFEIRA